MLVQLVLFTLIVDSWVPLLFDRRILRKESTPVTIDIVTSHLFIQRIY